jgi:hypothetical protein
MDSSQIKWYSILATFFVALIESIVSIIIFLAILQSYSLECDWSLVYKYADIFVPILFLINLSSSKELGEKIIYLQLPNFPTARQTLANTMFLSHLLAINGFYFYLVISNSTFYENLEDIGELAWSFLVINIVISIILAIVFLLPNRLFGYILGKIVVQFKP